MGRFATGLAAVLAPMTSAGTLNSRDAQRDASTGASADSVEVAAVLSTFHEAPSSSSSHVAKQAG